MPEWSQAVPAAVRREQIVSIIERQGFARVQDLSRTLSVSEVTIRTDLDFLAEANVIQRVRGGAMSGIRSTAHSPDYDRALARATTEKRRIGHAAAALVESEMAILLDAGTTTLAIARALRARDELRGVVVFTNSLTIALELGVLEPHQITVVVTGGTVNFKQRSLIDPLGDMFVGSVHSDLGFIGCNGVSTRGFTNSSLPEVTMKRRYLDSSARRIVVADSSKVGKSQVIQVAPLDAIDLLLTGVEAPPAEVDALREAGLTIELV
ncbi:DeoR/GlpR family DNA-binding transcription regulator [Microbacterium resistens]|uniref:DeoR/GlpR family DNA-binding transcription regulator n=1 Tax=Microbacterium resistens TaxID=156977 RepID=UPI00083794BD|nr:DeoR/GlpR family DNA-binding transcription regulator [Microbacterium resistens]